MSRVSVFGSTGFVGSRFCSLFPDNVIKIPRESKIPESDDILYLISTTTNYNVFSDLQLDIDTNLKVLMELCKNLSPSNTINFVSSWFVYGDTDLPAKETSECHPKGFYSITKYCAEQLLVSFCETFDIKYRIFRLANVYGLGDSDVSAKKNALLYLINRLHNNEEINLYYNGDFIRDYIHVDDVCYAIDHCLSFAPYNSITNIGSGVPYKFMDLIAHASNKLNSSSRITEISPSKFHSIVQVKDMYLDISKLNNYGFYPRINIYDGLDEYIKSL